MLHGSGILVAATATAVLVAACGGGGSGDVPVAAGSPGEAVYPTNAALINGSPAGVADGVGGPQLRAKGHFGTGSIVTTPVTATATVVIASEWQPGDVAALSGGRFAIATRAGVHTFDGTGKPIGEFLVSLPGIPYVTGHGPPPYYEPIWTRLYEATRDTAVAAAGHGGYVAVWTGYSRYRYDEFNRLYVTRGTPEGPLTLVAEDAARPDIAAAPGGFMVVWQTPYPASSEIYAKLFTGSAVGSTVRVNTATAGSQSQPKVAGLGDGSYVVVWTSAGQDGSGQGIYAQRFDGSGTRVGAETRVNTTTDGDQAGPAITALNDGGYLVVWTSPDGDGTGIFSQRFDSGGNPAGGEVRVNTTTAGNQGSPAPMALSDGGYVVRWDSSGTVQSQYFNADGSPDGAEVSSSPGATSWSVAMAGLSDSRFAVTFAADQVYAQVFEDALVGSDGRDRLAASQRIHLLRGMDGDDRLEGGAGSDTLDGGGGEDHMAGGAGDDIYIVDSDKDKVLEHPGEGRDTVKSSVSHALDHEVEDLVLTGSEAIDGTGNAQDNVITGNAAPNRLSGGLGNDTLDGGGGHDTFVFDTRPALDNIDTLKNFVAAEDTIELDGRIFKGLHRGPLNAAAFGIGDAAANSSHRIMFDPVTKALLYDPDGAGGQPAVQFATFEKLVGSLSAANFVVK